MMYAKRATFGSPDAAKRVLEVLTAAQQEYLVRSVCRGNDAGRKMWEWVKFEKVVEENWYKVSGEGLSGEEREGAWASGWWLVGSGEWGEGVCGGEVEGEVEDLWEEGIGAGREGEGADDEREGDDGGGERSKGDGGEGNRWMRITHQRTEHNDDR